MGQAKLRGTFEQRRADAIKRNTKQAEEEHRQKVEWWSSLSAEDQEYIRNSRKRSAEAVEFFAGIYGMVGAGLVGATPWPRQLK